MSNRHWSILGPILLLTGTLCSAANVGEFLDRWFSVQTNVHSWTADFTQTRNLKVLTQPLVGTGKVWVTVPNMFRWELGNPAQTIAFRRPDQLVIEYPRLKRAEKYSLENIPPGPMKDALALLDASMPTDRKALEDRFQLLSITESNAIFQVVLEPKSASARKFISEIRIGLHTNDFSMASTQMSFADGSSLRNDFTRVVLNPALDPALFEVKLPPDFTVVEPLQR